MTTGKRQRRKTIYPVKKKKSSKRQQKKQTLSLNTHRNKITVSPLQQERKHIKENKRERATVINSGKSRKMKARELEYPGEGEEEIESSRKE